MEFDQARKADRARDGRAGRAAGRRGPGSFLGQEERSASLGHGRGAPGDIWDDLRAITYVF